MAKRLFFKKRAFTLLEVILALAMTALVLTATAQIFSLVSKIDRTQDAADENSRIAHYVLRQVSGDVRRVWNINARSGWFGGSYWYYWWWWLRYYNRFDPEIYYLAVVKDNTNLETITYQFFSSKKTLYRQDSSGTKLIAEGVKEFIIRPHDSLGYKSYYITITVAREPGYPEAKIDTVVASHQTPNFYYL